MNHFAKSVIFGASVVMTCGNLNAVEKTGELIIAQAITTPTTPTLELLGEVPAKVETKPEIATALPAPSPQNVPGNLKALRPQATTLGGQDSNPGQSRPGHLKTVPGMDSGVQITRITDSESYGAHNYSKRQAWNADETLIDIGGKILDVNNNYSHAYSVNMSSEHQWSYTNPNLLIGIKYDPKATHLVTYDLKSEKETHLYNFSSYEGCTMGDFEGSTSIDDRYLALACKDSSGDKHIVSFDLVERKVLGTITAEWDFNWASYTLSGNHILVENNDPGGSDREILRYDRNLKNQERILKESQHGDLGFDVNGDDVYVMIDWDYIFYVRIKDGARVNLGFTNRAGNGHVSCKAIKRSGWCYFASRDQHQRLFAAQIGIEPNSEITTDSRGRKAHQGLSVVEMWGFSKSTYSSYANQAKASVSPSGRKIVYSSDWWRDLNPHFPHPGGGGEAHEYILELTE